MQERTEPAFHEWVETANHLARHSSVNCGLPLLRKHLSQRKRR